MRALGSLSLLLVVPTAAEPLKGAAAFGDWRSDAPGVERLIRPDDVARMENTRASSASARVVKPPPDAKLRVPDGFSVSLFASGLDGARTLRVAPNGDIFVAQMDRDVVTVLRPSPDGSRVAEKRTFATGLDAPFGLAFYPPGPDPQWLYVAATNAVERIPYRVGDLLARGKPETLVKLPEGGHATRDVLFSRDGARMFVSVGSASNIGAELGPAPRDMAAFEKTHGTGGAWGYEEWRATVLEFKPDGSDRKVFGTGLRNCVSITLAPQSDRLWCATNERDMMGDDLPPDYATEVKPGAFYGWPWFYIGANADERLEPRRDLAGKVTTPDVLFQAHSAPLGIAFYEGQQFPQEYRGDAFVALHGSWNRAKRTGYKIVRLRFENGQPTGAYQDFVTGFVVNDSSVWGRPVSVAVAKDGSLLFSEDGNGTIWRVAWTGKTP